MEVLGPTVRLISDETVDDTSVAYGMIGYQYVTVVAYKLCYFQFGDVMSEEYLQICVVCKAQESSINGVKTLIKCEWIGVHQGFDSMMCAVQGKLLAMACVVWQFVYLTSPVVGVRQGRQGDDCEK